MVAPAWAALGDDRILPVGPPCSAGSPVLCSLVFHGGQTRLAIPPPCQARITLRTLRGLPRPARLPLRRRSILADEINFSRSHWDGISDEAKDFVKMLVGGGPQAVGALCVVFEWVCLCCLAGCRGPGEQLAMHHAFPRAPWMLTCGAA